MKAELMAVLLQAVALVESGGDVRAVGRAGERGEFQIAPAVAAEVGGYGRREAEAHMRRLERLLVHAQIDPQPFNLALAWNAGIGAVRGGRAPESSYQYAVRVRNLFEALQRENTKLTDAPTKGPSPER